MSSRAATARFAALLGAAILLRVWLALALPFGQTVSGRLEGLNDEPAHYNVVRHLVERRSFAVQTRHVAEPGAFARADFEYYQPPLYYLLCAPLVAAAGERAGVMACRLVSLACGLLSLVVLSRVLAQLGLRPAPRRAGVVFVALLPVHAYFTSVVSNDGLCWLIALLLTRELLARARGDSAGGRAARGRSGLGADLRLGALLGLGMLTKSALVVFYPVALLGYALIERRGPGRRVLAGALVALSVSLVIAGWWYVRNVMVYGSPFAMEVGFGPPEPGRWNLFVQAHAAAGTVRTFWFPMQHLEGTGAVTALRAVGALLLAVHASAALAYVARRVPFDAPTFVALALLAATTASYVGLNLMWGESEGRFLLPALGPLVFLFVAPVFAWTARRPDGARLAWVYLVALAVHPWLFLALV
jgi:4-amino-4-deoxy-L-arabinose transferase-like glycosyltransferase